MILCNLESTQVHLPLLWSPCSPPLPHTILQSPQHTHPEPGVRRDTPFKMIAMTVTRYSSSYTPLRHHSHCLVPYKYVHNTIHVHNLVSKEPSLPQKIILPCQQQAVA